jgi:nucleoside-diphosphate-sugar epimerase
MRIAVTGGLGFIGSEIVWDLLDRGHEVIICDFWEGRVVYDEDYRHPIRLVNYRNMARAFAVVTPFELVTKMSQLSPAVIVHAGAVVKTTCMERELFEQNVGYTAELCTEASRVGAHMVFLSSFSVYGLKGYPNNPYGLTKSIAEKHVNAMKTRTSCLRLVNVFGQLEHHKDDMVSLPFKLSAAYKQENAIDMWALDAKRDFVPVDNIREVVWDQIDAMCGPSLGDSMTHQTFDVGTGESTTLADLDLFMMQAKKRDRSVVREIPMPAHFEGRYQTHTRAGMYGIPVLTGTLSTRQGIEMYYGK